MQTLRDIAPYVALGAAVVDLVLLVLLGVVMRRLGRLRAAQQVVLGGRETRDVVAHAVDLEEQVRSLRAAVATLDATLAGHKAELDDALTDRAVVRFDAFHDIGGQQSAAIALLDRHGSGVVVSSIHSRDYARLYVKELRRGVPDRDLSPEEAQVVAAAVAARRAAGGTPIDAAPRPADP